MASIISSNYEVLQLSVKDKGKYNVGDVFTVPDYYRNKPRFMKFDGLAIRAISYGFGVFLHFNFHEWEKNIPDGQ